LGKETALTPTGYFVAFTKVSTPTIKANLTVVRALRNYLDVLRVKVPGGKDVKVGEQPGYLYEVDGAKRLAWNLEINLVAIVGITDGRTTEFADLIGFVEDEEWNASMKKATS
jgi:hypothetical protein